MVADHQGRWFVLRRDGTVVLYADGPTFSEVGTALDISDQVVTTFQDQPAEFGALGLALDPEFENNGFVYIYYTANSGIYEARLSRFYSADRTTIDPASQTVLLSIPLTSGIHVGGTIAFHPDGFLYVGVGDGGVYSVGGGGNAQDPFSLMGKMLRLDVSGALPYTIPSDNPFADGQDGAPEVYALGLRNPFRWSIDSATGDLWLGDVGANAWEEINLIERGANYGWPFREGAQCWGTSSCPTAGLVDPVFQYAHTPGSNAVIGGIIYSGAGIPSLTGSYLFADRYSGLYRLTIDGDGDLVREQLSETGGITAFAQDTDGVAYVLKFGKIERLIPEDDDEQDDFPQLLSQTGCFDQSDPLQPAPGLIPYEIIAPLWSDNAEKVRYMALPDDGFIGIDDQDDWIFPLETVLIKTFFLNEEPIETRLFVRHEDGDWGGYSYEWNDARTDAVLLPGAKVKEVGDQTWRFPSRGECFQCHTDVAGRSLGPETAQMNSDILYPSSQVVANQIETLRHIGMFDIDPGDPKQLPALSFPTGGARVDERARAYLHANCSMCHRAGGTGLGPADFRYQLTGNELGIFSVAPTQGDLGLADAALWFPGHPDKSVISLRMKSLSVERMPPLGTAIVDEMGTALIDAWIESGLGFGAADSDGDEIADYLDNCIVQSNGPAAPDAGGNVQRDTDGDGYGNACDGDLNNDGIVNASDLVLFRLRFFTDDADADLNGDGIVNAADLSIVKLGFFAPPGPSGVAVP